MTSYSVRNRALTIDVEKGGNLRDIESAFELYGRPGNKRSNLN